MTSLVTLVPVRAILCKNIARFGLPYFHEFYIRFFFRKLRSCVKFGMVNITLVVVSVSVKNQRRIGDIA